MGDSLPPNSIYWGNIMRFQLEKVKCVGIKRESFLLLSPLIEHYFNLFKEKPVRILVKCTEKPKCCGTYLSIQDISEKTIYYRNSALFSILLKNGHQFGKNSSKYGPV